MFKVLIDGLMVLIQGLISIVLAPIDAILIALFPDITSFINIYEMVIQTYIAPTVSFVYSILPPLTRSLVLLYCSFMVVLGTALISYHAFTYIYRLIQKIKFW